MEEMGTFFDQMLFEFMATAGLYFLSELIRRINEIASLDGAVFSDGEVESILRRRPGQEVHPAFFACLSEALGLSDEQTEKLTGAYFRRVPPDEVLDGRLSPSLRHA